MLGKKCSLAPLNEELRIQEVPKITHTEFCQGQTMTWALAWSFYDDVIVTSPPSKQRKLEGTHHICSVGVCDKRIIPQTITFGLGDSGRSSCDEMN